MTPEPLSEQQIEEALQVAGELVVVIPADELSKSGLLLLSRALLAFAARLRESERALTAKTEDFFKFFEAAAVEYTRAEAAEQEAGRLRLVIARQLTSLDVAAAHIGILRRKSEEYGPQERDNVALIAEQHVKEARTALFASLAEPESDEALAPEAQA